MSSAEPPFGASDAVPEPTTTGLPECAPTEAGPKATEDTSISQRSGSTTAEAWSEETEPLEPDSQTWRKTSVMAAIVAFVGIAVAGAVWFAHLALSKGDPRMTRALATSPTPTMSAAPPPAPTPTPTPTPTSVAAPSSPATTVQASPSTVQPPAPDVGISPEMVAWYDRQFIANLRYNGAAIADPVALAHQAHRVCAMLQKGATRDDVIQQIVAASGWNYFTATMFTSTAMSTYPDCP